MREPLSSVQVRKFTRRSFVAAFVGGVLGKAQAVDRQISGQWTTCPYTDGTGAVVGRFRAYCSSFEVDIGGGQAIRFSLIPAGQGLRGASIEWSPFHRLKAEPVKIVQVPAFLLATYVLTTGQWLRCEELPRFGRSIPSKPFAHPFTRDGEERWPVEDMRWVDAAEIADRLRLYSGIEVRLPSETEWEYACRAGTESRYYFGESYGPSLPDSPVLGRRFRPVGSIDAPNRYGLHDMYGPIGSWCSDWAYPDYSFTPVNGDPLLGEPGVEEYRIIRGNLASLGSAERDFFPKLGSFTGSGLRLAMSIPERLQWTDPTIRILVDGESGRADEVTPGKLFTVLGDFPVAMDPSLDTDSEVEVYLDDTKANLIERSANEISASTPLGLTPGATVKVVVRVGFQSTAPRDAVVR